MRELVIYVIVFGALPFVLTRPNIGIYLWCWISYMNPHRLAYSTATQNFPFAAIIAGITIISVILSKEPKRFSFNSLTATWLLFVAWISITTIFAIYPEDAYAEWTRAIKIQLMTFVTIIALNTREKINGLVWIIVLSLGFYAVKGGIFVILTGGEYMVWGPEDTFIGGNTSLAMALVMTLPLMRYLQLTTTNKWIWLGLSGSIALTLLSIISSYSRGAFLALIVMTVYFVLKSRKKAGIIVLAVLAIPFVISFMPDKWFEKIETIETYEQDRSAMGRINAWWFAYNLAKDKPIAGGGFGAFNPELFDKYAPDPTFFQDSHSIYFEVLGEHGFIGLFLFLILGFLAIRTGTKIIRKAKTREDLVWVRDLVSMTQVSIIGYAVAGAFLGLAYFDFYYHLIALIVLSQIMVDRALEEPEETQSGEMEDPVVDEIAQEEGR